MCKIYLDQKWKIENIAKRLNENIKIYQMNINPDAFKLDVSEIEQDT